MSAHPRPTASRRGAAAAWSALNKRQCAYLRAIYREDQATEADMAARRREWLSVPPAAEWRTLTFSVDSPAARETSIQRRLQAAGIHDPGAGSTLAALARRGLIEVIHDDTIVLGAPVPRVRVRMTRAGRATARAGLDESAPARPPKGLLKRWLWWRLVAIARAGEPGAGTDVLGHAGEWWVYLDGRGRGYVEQRPDHPDRRGRWAYHLTEAGAAHIAAHRSTYQRLYPDIDTTDLPDSRTAPPS